jgi:hypothetical protein
MHQLVEQIEPLVLPQLERLAPEMRAKYPSFHFNVWHAPEGASTSHPGYSLGIECVFPGSAASAPNNVALIVDLWQPMPSTPKLMANVVWGHPSGEVEAAFPANPDTTNPWAEATPEKTAELTEILPELIQAFETAVQRAAPPSPPKVDFGGMTVNERLSAAGLMTEFHAAAASRDRERMISVLGKVGLASQAAQIADAISANPKRYGFWRPFVE